VPVPEVNVRHILETTVNKSNDEMIKQLYDWCLVGNLPPQEGRDRANKRDWSSIEN